MGHEGAGHDRGDAGVPMGQRCGARGHSVVRENCRLGDDVILQNGAIVGSDGFGFARVEGGGWYKILQSGPAILDDDVEIQANACIDRARVGHTHLASGVKVDNLVQVGHGSAAKLSRRELPSGATTSGE